MRRIASLLAAPLMISACSKEAPPPAQVPIDEIIASMTTVEKVDFLVGVGMNFGPKPDSVEAVRERVPGAAGQTHAIARLGIPSLTLADGPAGVRISPTRKTDSTRTWYATAFPVATSMAATWDVDLERKVGAAYGREAREYGVDILLAPGMNIHRNPLGGRNFEYFSEDPLLSGRMAAAFTDGVQSEGVGVSLKHFDANNQEFNRQQLDTRVSRRALREIYLRGFEIAVREANPWTVMSAYNRINGTYASESHDLLTSVLRDDWGFEGFVMTDWFAGRDVVAQMNAGNDMIMPGSPSQRDSILAAVADGRLSSEVIDLNAARVLRVLQETPAGRGYEYSDRPDLVSAGRTSRDAAAQGMVLLKNDGGVLPLARGTTIALLGNAGYDLIKGGTGSGDVHPRRVVSLDEGLESGGFRLIREIAADHLDYRDRMIASRPKLDNPFALPPPIPEMPLDRSTVQAALEADAAVLVIGRNSGEFADREIDGDFELTAVEQQNIRQVSEAFRTAGKPFVVIMNVGGVTETSSWRDRVDAILVAWQPGQDGGYAITDVLVGDVNPSGRLPMTFPVAYADVPSAPFFPGEVLSGEEDSKAAFFGRPARVSYDEGIYVGYRHYDTRGVEPAYPFGFGLSYTEFSWGAAVLDGDTFDGEMGLTVEVTNGGRVAGRDVVQVYVSAPTGALDKPDQELRAFAKTGEIAPGGSETLSFALGPRDLASFDVGRSAWIVEAGTYEVRVGASSRDIRQRAVFTVPAEIVVEQVRDVLHE